MRMFHLYINWKVSCIHCLLFSRVSYLLSGYSCGFRCVFYVTKYINAHRIKLLMVFLKISRHGVKFTGCIWVCTLSGKNMLKIILKKQGKKWQNRVLDYKNIVLISTCLGSNWNLNLLRLKQNTKCNVHTMQILCKWLKSFHFSYLPSIFV